MLVGHSVRVIPTAILGAIILGSFVRWWAVPTVAVLWAAVVVIGTDAGSWLAALALGGANAIVGVAMASIGRRWHKILTRPTIATARR